MKQAVKHAGLLALLLAGTVHAQMSAPGQFAADRSGAATYSIPVQLPPAVAGLAPQLALTYSSQGGNGLLGMGWDLSGLSSITRCPMSKAQDNAMAPVKYDAGDRYCLDGQKLFPVSGTNGANGTEYRAEMEGYAKVISYAETGATNGPGSFVVKTKAGLTMEYGKTEDSRIEAQGRMDGSGHGVVAAWALNKVTDAKGNAYTFTYVEDNANGVYVPSRVDMGKTSAFFIYDQTRPDVVQGYELGGIYKNIYRLTEVRTGVATSGMLANSAAANVLSYSLAYGTSPAGASLLNAIKVCSLQTASCLPSSNFTWGPTPGSNTWAISNSSLISGGANVSQAWINYSGWRVITGDFNGDGRTDFMLQLQCSGCNASSTPIFFSKGDGTWDIVNQPLMYSGVNVSQNWINANGWQVITGDFNGDGKTDFLLQLQCSGCSAASTPIFLSNGDGTWTISNNALMSGGVNVSQAWLNASGWRMISGDFNGDGRTDFLMQLPAGAQSTPLLLSKGDGTWDIINQPLSYAGVNVSQNWINASGWQVLTGDFNGDGRTDFLLQLQCSGCSAASTPVFLSNGDGTWAVSNNAVMSGGVNVSQAWLNASGWRMIPGDFNGDGKTDFLMQLPAGAQSTPLLLSKGDGSWAVINTSLMYSGVNVSQNWINASGWQVLAADFNGDGRTDFMLQLQCSGCSAASTPMFLSKGDGTWTISNQALNYSGVNVSQNWINSLGWQVITGDFNGDGKTDFLLQLQCSGCSAASTPIFMSTAERGETITAVNSGFSTLSLTYAYQPQTLGIRYIKDLTTTLPIISVGAPVLLLTDVSATDGVGGVRSTSYSYGNSLAEVVGGRGSLGFQWMQTKDNATGLVSRTYYRQDFPYLGMVDKVGRGTTDANWSNLALSTNEYSFKAFIATDTSYASPVSCTDTQSDLATCKTNAIKPGNRYIVYPSKVVEKSWDWNDQSNVFTAMPQKRTSTVLNNWADPTQIKVEVLDTSGSVTGFSKTTDTVYSTPDVANWKLGRVIKSSVTAVSP